MSSVTSSGNTRWRTTIPTKTSIGIIIGRKNTETGRPEVLLVKKRVSYEFAEFAHGRYITGSGRRGGNGNDHHHSYGPPFRTVAALLDNMTREELFDIWSLNFEQIWFRVWLTRDTQRELYNRKYAKFQSTFMRDDAGAALRRAVMASRAGGVVLWEVPKGRRLNPREADVICAVREVREETAIDKSEYRLLPGIKRRVSHVSNGCRYVSVYYVAIANPHLAKRSLSIRLQAEVSEVGWHDIEHLRLLGTSPESHLEPLVAPAFRLMKQYWKGRWASRPPPPASWKDTDTAAAATSTVSVATSTVSAPSLIAPPLVVTKTQPTTYQPRLASYRSFRWRNSGNSGSFHK